MASSSSSRFSVASILAGAATTVAVSGIAYAVYFDYRRRNDKDFRRQILKEHRKVAKQASAEASRNRVETADALKNAVREMKNEPVPTNVEEREAYFLEQVAIGEALAARGPAFYVPAAISFFKGLQVYPQPQELLMIYSKTQPAEVVQLLMEALKLSISEGGPSSSVRQAPRGQAILEEIDTDSAEDKDSSSQKEKTEEASSQSGDQASSTSSPAANSYVDVEVPASAST